jgi:hypothetical protein
MIPEKLSMHSFMSYRDNGLHSTLMAFTRMPLCGGNGNRKSALFDAIYLGIMGKDYYHILRNLKVTSHHE